MTTMQWIVTWGLGALAAAVLAAAFAGYKNRDISYWTAWCFILPPLIVVLMLLPRHQGPRPRQPRLDDLDHDRHSAL